jgi:hypothetical protein
MHHELSWKSKRNAHLLIHIVELFLQTKELQRKIPDHSFKENPCNLLLKWNHTSALSFAPSVEEDSIFKASWKI